MNIRIENEPCKKLHIKETLKVRYEIDVTSVDKGDTQNQRYFTGTGISSDPKDAKLYTSIDDAKADFKNVPKKFNGSVIRDVRVARRFVNITEPDSVAESNFSDTKYFALMSYTPGNRETGIYGDNCDTLDVVSAKNEYEAANKFEKKFGSKINRRTEFVSEISKDEYYQILAELDTMTESFDNANYLDNDNCLGYAIQIRSMNTGYIDLLCYNTKDLATQNLTIAELMGNETNYDVDVYEDDFNTIYGTTDNIIQEIDFRRDLENGKIYGKEDVLVYGNDDGFYVIMNKIPVDLYF